jgi:two-component system, sensor histidine kinase and response regulator
MKIMICEEDPQQIRLIKNVLNNFRFKHIIPKKDGDVYKMAIDQKPAIIIFNEKFYNSTGEGLLNQLRSNPQTNNIPIIYISSDLDLNEKLKRYSDDSFVQLLKEPYRLKFFRHYIDRWTTFRSLYVKQ